MMFTQPNIDVEGLTFQERLELLCAFGPRYRIWPRQSSKTALFPQQALASLQADRNPLLAKRCEVEQEKVTIGGRTFSAWRVYFDPQKALPSPYIIEDLLASWCVGAWLQQQEPDQIVAVLTRDAKLSTFLQNYYLDILGYVPEGLETARLPLWCAYLEGLIHGLNPNQRLASVEVCAEVLFAWFGKIAAICTEFQGEPGLTLNDGENKWQNM